MNSVSNILKINFAKLPLQEKLKIKDLGRPLPELKLTKACVNKAENRSFTRRFSKDTYTKNKWICGCDVLDALFCFPCLLFYEPGMDVWWARNGVKDIQHIPEKMRKHENTHLHINACIEFGLLGQADIKTQLSSAYRYNIVKHNEKVRLNRYALKKLICCLRFCNVFELALKGIDEREDSLNCVISIDFMAELDLVLKERLQNSIVLNGTTIRNDILDCMLAVCREEISHQIENSEFLSVQCDETTDVSNYCQMVLILRYFYEGAIREYFWGFLQVKDKTADGLKTCIEKEIDPLILNSPGKLIAQTYDGGNIMCDSVNGVQAKIKTKYPWAYFIHCYAHQLHFIIQKASSQNSKVRVFFYNLSAFPAFFSNSTHRCHIFDEILKNKLPKVAGKILNYNINTVSEVYENRDKLIEVFVAIEERCYKTVTLREASGLRRALQDPEFMFWLTFFRKIVQHVYIFYNNLQSKDTNSKQLKYNLLKFKKLVCNIRGNTYDIQENFESCFGNRKRGRTDDSIQLQENLLTCEESVSSVSVKVDDIQENFESNSEDTEKRTDSVQMQQDASTLEEDICSIEAKNTQENFKLEFEDIKIETDDNIQLLETFQENVCGIKVNADDISENSEFEDRKKSDDHVKLQQDLLISEDNVCSIKDSTNTIQENLESNMKNAKRKRADDSIQNTEEVCDLIIMQLKDRFSYRGYLQAAELFNNESFSKFHKVFPLHILNEVVSCYPVLIKPRLKIELKFLYSRPDLREIIGAMNILSFMLKNNLMETFSETIKLLKIIVTTPMITTESERCFQTTKLVKTFLRNNMVNDRLNALAMMCINRSLVHEINNFEERVMEKFISMKDCAAEFNFKV